MRPRQEPYKRQDRERAEAAFADAIRQGLVAAMEDAGWSQRQVARLTKVPHSVLSNFIKRRRSLTVETAAVLADFLGWELRAKGR